MQVSFWILGFRKKHVHTLESSYFDNGIIARYV